MQDDDVYHFTVKDIDGQELSLAKFRGQALLIVNVASRCGHTPQYAGMESLYRKYHAQGLEVLGFPANEFAAEEPGSDAEIKAFCTSTYNVSFPMFSKLVAKGPGIHALYKFLTVDSPFPGEISWNFEKFLVSKDGRVIQRFSPKTKPESEAVVKAIETALV